MIDFKLFSLHNGRIVINKVQVFAKNLAPKKSFYNDFSKKRKVIISIDK